MLIQEYGLFWDAGEIDWTPHDGDRTRVRAPDGVPRCALLGRQGRSTRTLRVSDFWDQRGIYILYGNYGPHYVGVTIDRGIGRRLKEHLKDRHQGKWDRFSWYGFKRALTGRNTVGLSDLGQMASARMVQNRLMIAELEALLIHAMGLQNIRQTRFPQAERWVQVKDHERADYLEKLKPGRRPVQRRTTARRRTTVNG